MRSAGSRPGEADALERQADSLARASASVDLPVPGVSSISRCPWASRRLIASRTWFCLPSRTAQVDSTSAVNAERAAPDPSSHGRVVDVEHQKLATAIDLKLLDLATGFTTFLHDTHQGMVIERDGFLNVKPGASFKFCFGVNEPSFLRAKRPVRSQVLENSASV